MLLCIVYFAIGRDLIAVAGAKKDAAEMEIRREVHQVTKDLENLAGVTNVIAAEDVSPVTFTSAAALAGQGDSTDVEAMLNGRPIETCSRAP